MRVRWKRSLCFLVLMVGRAGEAAAQLGIEFGVESFRWREFEAGSRLLEESGPRYRLGANWLAPLGGDPWDAMELRGAFYFGSVDYDGEACTPCFPFQTDTVYLGVGGEVSLLHRLGAAGRGEIFAGGGVDSWERDVRGRADVPGRGNVSGAIENWTVFYLLGGAGRRWTEAARRYRFQAGVKYPFYTYEFAEAYDVAVKPKGRLSMFARLAVDFVRAGNARSGLGIYYDSYRFDMSDVERIVWQPESDQDVIGLYGIVYLN